MTMITITGRLGKEPEIKYFESGNTKAVFTVATSSWNGKENVTNWFECELWGKRAETMIEMKNKDGEPCFSKGKTITVMGQMTESEYKEKKYYKINVLDFGFDNAYAEMSGKVELHEKRIKNDREIQYIKLENNPYTIETYSKVEIAEGDFIECLCEIGIREYKFYAKALKIVSSNLKTEKATEDEKITDEEIPF